MDKQYQHVNYGFQPQQDQLRNVIASPSSGAPSSGYITTTSGYIPPPGVNALPPHGYVTQTTLTTEKGPSGLRTAIPELPMALAVIYCVVNFLLPGIGTILAGFSVLCCGNVGQSGGGRFGTFCINFWVGICQLILLFFFFIGWIWSILWGIAFIAISAEADQRQTQTTSTVITTGAVPPVHPQQQPPYTEKPTLFY